VSINYRRQTFQGVHLPVFKLQIDIVWHARDILPQSLFLRHIHREFPGKTPLHLVMDNYGTHGTPEVKDWLRRLSRFKVHYIPTSSSWLNLIERWFGELASKRIRRDSFLSVDELIAAVNEFLAAWNQKPRPFVWTATVESILDKLARCRQTLEQIQPGCKAPKTRKRKSS
jgi:transposase